MEIFNTPAFGVLFSLVIYIVGHVIYSKTKWSILNPMFISVVIIIVFLKTFNIDPEYFNSGGKVILFFLGPATVILAVPLYRQFELLKKHYLPILIGVLFGSASSLLSIILISKFLGFDRLLILSLLPKSVTMPIGMEISRQYEAIIPITIVSIVITGISGAVIAPYVCRFFRIKDDIAKGIAIGTASHAVGTSKAIEMGESIGAMSGLAIGLAGVITVFLMTLVLNLI